MNRSYWTSLVACATLAVAGPAAAQPMAEHVPSDSFVYVGWTGGQAMPESYEGTTLQAMLEDTQFVERASQLVDAYKAGIRRYADDFVGPGGQDVALTALVELLPAVYDRPWAFYVNDIEFTDYGEPIPSLGLIIDPGDYAGQIREFGQMIEDEAGRDAPFAFVEVDGLMAFVVGNDVDRNTLPLGDDAPLTEEAGFIGALAHTPDDPLVVAYYDIQSALALFRDLLEQEGGEDAPVGMIEAAIESIGIDGLHRVVATGAFTGPNWQTTVFLDAPGERAGLLGLLDPEPFDEDLLRVVPESSPWVNAFQIDIHQAYQEIRNVIGEIDEDTLRQFDDAIDAFAVEVQVDFDEEVLGALGPQWVFYIDKHVGLGVGSGIVAINQPRDADALEASLTKLGDWANQAMSNPDFAIGFTTLESHDVTIHTLSSPVIAPSWAFSDGLMFVAMNPQALVTSIQLAQSEGSLLDQPNFQEARARLPESLNSVSYIDLDQTAPGAYQLYTNLAQTFALTVSIGDEAQPATILPTIVDIQPYLAPVAGGSYADEDGLYFISTSPFPGSEVLSLESQVMSMAPSFFVGAMLGLQQARTSAFEVQQLSSGRQIGISLHAYAADNQNKTPDHLFELLPYIWDAGFLTGQNPPAPPNFLDWPEADQAQWLDQHAVWVLMPAVNLDGLNNPWETVAAVGPIQSGGYPVAFFDGHVQMLPEFILDDYLQRQIGQTYMDYLNSR